MFKIGDTVWLKEMFKHQSWYTDEPFIIFQIKTNSCLIQRKMEDGSNSTIQFFTNHIEKNIKKEREYKLNKIFNV